MDLICLEGAKHKKLWAHASQRVFPLLGSLPFRLEAVQNKRLPTDSAQSAFPVVGSLHVLLNHKVAYR